MSLNLLNNQELTVTKKRISAKNIVFKIKLIQKKTVEEIFYIYRRKLPAVEKLFFCTFTSDPTLIFGFCSGIKKFELTSSTLLSGSKDSFEVQVLTKIDYSKFYFSFLVGNQALAIHESQFNYKLDDDNIFIDQKLSLIHAVKTLSPTQACLYYIEHHSDELLKFAAFKRNVEVFYEFKLSLKPEPIRFLLNNFLNLDIEILNEIDNWLCNTTTTLILIGGAGIGKTELAKAILEQFNPKIIRNINDFKYYKIEYHKGLIFDDISWEEISRNDKIHLLTVDSEAPVRILYESVHLEKNLKKIITCNTLDGLELEDPSLKRRVTVIHLGNYFLY